VWLGGKRSDFGKGYVVAVDKERALRSLIEEVQTLSKSVCWLLRGVGLQLQQRQGVTALDIWGGELVIFG
jgi:hypothetical protein